MAVNLVPACAVVVGCALVYSASPSDGWIVRLGVVMAVAAVIESFSVLNHAVCRAHERFDLEAGGEILEGVVLFALGGAALLVGLLVVYVGLAAIVAAVFELALSIAFVRRFVRLAVVWPRDVRLLRSALP